MIRSTILALFAVAFVGFTSAWSGGGYYDRYNVAPMRADQDTGFGSLFESNRRHFQNSRMNTSGEYMRYRNDGMDYYPRNDGYGYGGQRSYNDYDYGYGGQNNGRYLTRYRPNRNSYYNGYDYDYGYNGNMNRGGRQHWDNRDYTSGSYDYGYSNRNNRGYGSRYGNNGYGSRYGGNNDYWSYSQSPRSYSQGGYGPNNDSYRYY